MRWSYPSPAPATDDRSRRIRYGIHTQLCGLALVAVSVSAGLFLVVRFLFDWRAAVVIAGGIAALSVLTWLVRPAHDRRQANERNLR